MHIGVGSTASTSIASFSDSAHASVDPNRETAETVITTAIRIRIMAHKKLRSLRQREAISAHL